MADVASTLAPDRYTVQARLLPAFLLMLPIGLAAAVLVPGGVGLPGGAGLIVMATLLVAGRVRTAGRATQDRLWGLAGAPPATQALRWASDTPAAVQQRRHHLIQSITGVPLPTAAAEAGNPATADEAYTTAIRALIEHTRGHQVLLVENITYGMWRNLYAVKPAGLVLTVTAAVAMVVAVTAGAANPAAVALPLLVDAALGGVWTLAVTLDQLLDAQQIYVDQLLRAAETAQPA